MRQILAERDFPVDEIRFFASARSAGTVLPYARPRDRRRGRRDRRPERARHRAVLGRRHHLARAGADVRRGGRDRGRQLLGLPDGPRRAARRLRGQPGGDRRRPQGDHRQPELHDDGRDAGAQAAARRGRAGPADRVDVPGGLRQRCRRCRGARHPGRGGRRQGARAGLRRRGGRVPRAGEVRPHHRLQRAAAGRLDRRRRPATRPTRSRSSATSPARSSASPTCGSPGICVRVPVFTGHSLAINAEFAAADAGRARPRAARRRARASSSPTSRPRCRRPARTRRTSAGSARTRASTTTAGWRCSSATTTCARAPRSTPCRSPSWSPPRR